MSLSDVKHWVFDMDGTLTVAVHDFAAIRVALAIPPRMTFSPTSRRCRPTKRRRNMPGCWSMSAIWRWVRNRLPVRWSWCAICTGVAIAWAS